MKHLRSLFCAAALTLLFAQPCAAATLSPAISLLSAEETAVKAGLTNCDVIFSEQDFIQQTGIERFPTVTFQSVPDETDGVLKIGDTVIQGGMTVSRELLSKMVFRAADKSVDNASFTYTLPERYGSSTLCCRIELLDKINEAPCAAIATGADALMTYKNTALTGCLIASDPEGDDVSFRIVRAPKHGSLTLDKTSEGLFTYTPDKNYTGKDNFVFTVRDEYGNYSKNCTVTVRTVRNKKGISFGDTTETSAASAAITCTASGWMSGTTVGGDAFFEPDGTVTRAEFVTALLAASNIDCGKAAASTFADSDAIPEKYKSAVATAVKLGLVSGDAETGLFRPNEPITRAEAATIALRLFGGKTGAVQTFADSNAVPQWAENAITFALTNGLILPRSGQIACDAPLTRGDCAVFLAAASQIRIGANA